MKFYSEKLDKIFDTSEELVKAEQAAAKAAEEKTKKAEAKKAEAKVVEEAFKAHNAAKKEYNEKIITRRKKYVEDLAALKAAFEADIEAEAKKLDEAAKAYDKALKDFTAAHKEGYHMTLRDGDNVVSLRSSGNTENSSIFKSMLNDNWFDTFFNLFRI